MKEKMTKKKILLIVVVALLALFLMIVGVLVALKSNSTISDKIEYLKKVVYTQKLEDLGNPSKDIGIMLLDCDSLESFSDIQNVKVTTRAGKYVQGTGAFANMKFQNNLLFGTFKQAVDISKYEKGSVHISIYIEDKSCLTDGINFELASNGVCDSDELQWILPLSKIEEGWNEYYLSIDGAMKSGKPDLTNINFFRAYTINPNMGVTVILDNVYATDTEGVAYDPDPVPLKEVVPDGYKETAATNGKMLMSCNTVNVFKALEYVEVTTQKNEFVEGTGAFKTVGLQNLLLAGVFAEPVDLTDYKDGLIHVSLYINDVSLLKQEIFFELTSSGTWDADEYNWAITLDKLKNGWNELYLPFANAVITGKPNIEKLDFVRFFTIDQKEGLVTIIDNVYATNEGAKDAAKETTSLYGEMIMSGNTINVFKWLNCVKVTNKKNEYVEGTGAFKTIGYQNLLLEGVFAEPKDLSAYKGGSIHVSFYINDTKLLNDNIYLELTSSGTWDKDEYNWEITVSQLKNGWNQLYLPFANATVTGKPDIEKLDFVRFFTVDQKKGLVTIFDDVYATNKGAKDTAKETSSPYGEMIISGNTINVFKWLNCVEVTNKKNEYIEGTGALKTTGHQNLLLEGAFSEPKNLSAYKNGSIHVSLYINDTKLLKDNIYLELTSSGTWDKDEYNWEIPANQLKNGWNELYLPFANAMKTGKPNAEKLDFIRFFTVGQKKGLVTIFDNMYATNKKINNTSSVVGGEGAQETSSPYGKMIASCNTTDIFSAFNFVEKTTKKGEFVEGTGALKTVGKENLLIEATLSKVVDVSKYKDGFVHVAFYVNDKDNLTEELFFEMTSSGVCDEDEYNWSITAEELQNGWNELYLPFAKATITGRPNLKKINFFRAFTLNRKLGTVTIFDNIYATNSRYNESEIACAESVKAGDVMLSNCLCYFKDYENMKLTTGSKEGAYALKCTNSKNAMYGTFAKSVSIKEYKDGYIHVWIHINDVSYVTDGMEFVLSSSDKPDVNAYKWLIEKNDLTSGWNELWLPISGVVKIGSPNLSAINFFQTKAINANTKLKFVIDDVRAIKTK